MRRFLIAGLVVLAACDTGGSPVADHDASVDAVEPNPYLQPFDATFSTPAGTLTTTYVTASAEGCAANQDYAWSVRFFADDRIESQLVWLTFSLPWPRTDVTEPLNVRASPAPSPTEATFLPTHVDYPGDVEVPRLAGRFVLASDGWSVDLPVDLSGYNDICAF